MGIALEFYAGDAEIIGKAFTANEFDELRDGTRARAHADFSLHLSPTDLDILSDVIADHTGSPALLLNDSLIRTVSGIAENSGAELVDPAWVRMVAAADDFDVPKLTADWIVEVSAECGQQLAVTPEALKAVRELIQLCRTALRENVDVVHTWSL